jgi:hypothetical protein
VLRASLIPDAASRKAFKLKVSGVMEDLDKRLRKFDHYGWAQGNPSHDVPPKSPKEHGQFVNMFFYNGLLYWNLPHPVLCDYSFPMITINKNKETLAREANSAARKKAERFKVKKGLNKNIKGPQRRRTKKS